LSGILRRRPSPALVISLIALFVSLGGVSYGVATGFIDSREIRNNTVRTQDLRNNDVRGKDIRNSTVRTRDVAFNTLTGSDINESSLGAVARADTLDGIDSTGFIRYGSTIPTGTTVRGAFGGLQHAVVSFLTPAPADIVDGDVDFALGACGVPSQQNPLCNGSAANPTAPRGTVCLYATNGTGLSGDAIGSGAESRFGFVVDKATTDEFEGTWAYTAP
jgi:hypothetical protein